MKQWNEHCSSNSNRSGNTTRAVIAVAIIVILLIIVKGKKDLAEAVVMAAPLAI